MTYKDVTRRRKSVSKAVAKYKKEHGGAWWKWDGESKLTPDERRERIERYGRERDELIEKRSSQQLSKDERKTINDRVYVLNQMIKAHLKKLEG